VIAKRLKLVYLYIMRINCVFIKWILEVTSMATQNGNVLGTFSATGQSDDTKVSQSGRLRLSFAGTATVRLEEYSDQKAAFIATGDVYTATGTYALNGGKQRSRLRLSCTAYTDDVNYEILQ